MRFVNEQRIPLLLTCLFIVIAFAFRAPAVWTHHPFWVDEFSTAIQSVRIAQDGLGIFFHTPWLTEHQNITAHILGAISVHFFGRSEFAVKLPFLLIGSLLPGLVFLYVRKLTSLSGAIVAGIFVTFSYIQIAWSVQARGYGLQQFLLLLFALLVTRLQQQPKEKISWLALGLITVLGVLTHKLFIFVPLAGVCAVILTQKKALQWMKNTWLQFGLGFSVLLVAFLLFARKVLFHFISDGLLMPTNNFWYYHAFFWREYALFVLLAAVGMWVLWQKNRFHSVFLAAYAGQQLIFICFLFTDHVTKYALTTLLVIWILAAIGFTEILELLWQKFGVLSLSKQQQKAITFLLPLLIALGIVANGHHFVRKPQRYYSVNGEMREIAVVDYDVVYSHIKNSFDPDYPTVVIDTWLDRGRWYLGEDYEALALFRWTNGGPHRHTSYLELPDGTKYVPKSGRTDATLVSSVADLQLLMGKYPRGYLWVDDSTLPSDVIAFAKQSLQEELSIDSYGPELLENPYSRWPATLYSWGFESSSAEVLYQGKK